MTLNELLARARAALPRETADAASLLAWRAKIYSIRHTLPDGSRPAEVAESLAALIGAVIRLLSDDADPRVELQEHVWRFSRLKGNTTDEATAAAEEIDRRIASARSGQRRELLAQLYSALMSEEFRLLELAVKNSAD